MARVLFITQDSELAWLRKSVLATAGHQITVAESKKAALGLIAAEIFDVLVVCHTISFESAHTLAKRFCASNPDGRIVEVLLTPQSRPSLPEAEHVAGADGAEPFLAAVNNIAALSCAEA